MPTGSAATSANNKKKKNSQKKKVGFSDAAITKASSDERKMKLQQQQRGQRQSPLATLIEGGSGLSKGQLTALIMLSLGISRLMKLATASLSAIGGDDAKATNADKDGAAVIDPCSQHLGEAACRNESVQALLRYKYYSSIQMSALVFVMALQLWTYSEALLQLFDSCLVLAPTLPIVAALMLSPTDGLLDGRAQNIIMSGVLAVLAAPSSLQAIPFVTRRPLKQPKSIQTLCLLTLSMFSLWEGLVQTLAPIVLSPECYHFFARYLSSPSADGQQQQPQPMVIERLLRRQQQQSGGSSVAIDAGIQPAVTTLLYFFAVDKLTLALLYYFAWYYYPQSKQRVRICRQGCIPSRPLPRH